MFGCVGGGGSLQLVWREHANLARLLLDRKADQIRNDRAECGIVESRGMRERIQAYWGWCVVYRVQEQQQAEIPQEQQAVRSRGCDELL